MNKIKITPTEDEQFHLTSLLRANPLLVQLGQITFIWKKNLQMKQVKFYLFINLRTISSFRLTVRHKSGPKCISLHFSLNKVFVDIFCLYYFGGVLNHERDID